MNFRKSETRQIRESVGPGPLFPLEGIVSGGQTGVDRAALDAAIEFGLKIGGWCPKGRRAEDGRIPLKYDLRETEARSYAVRTEWNVRDSDGTLILALDEISSGTRLTIDAARVQSRPLKIEHLLPAADPAALITEVLQEQQQVVDVAEWICNHSIRMLNIAGPRGSSSPLMYPRARRFVQSVLAHLARSQ
jgi:hypothetical protein